MPGTSRERSESVEMSTAIWREAWGALGAFLII
jgi:hypothetical protein